MPNLRRGIIIIVFSLFVVFVVIKETGGWSRQFFVSDKNLESALVTVDFLDIGQGDATLLRFENGENMLVDCAVDGRILSALGRHFAFSQKTIDTLVVTHPDRDHYGGCAEVLAHYKVKTIITNGTGKEYDPEWRNFEQSMNNEPAEQVVFTTTTIWQKSGTVVSFLYSDLANPSNANNTSIVIKIAAGQTSLLLMADAEKPLEENLVKNYGAALNVDILKVGHHGSQTSTSDDWLKVTTPKEGIISVGKNNRYHHPALRVLKRLERQRIRIWRTDEQGDITLKIYSKNYLII